MAARELLVVNLAFYLAAFAPAQEGAALDALFARASQMDASDAAGANRLYQQAAGQGHVLSMVKLGHRKLMAAGGPRDLEGAFALFTAAANAGSADGKFLQAMSYLEGLGTQKNPTAAREALLVPADKGNQYAQYTLGIMMQNGEGGPRREAGARRWLDRAASGADPALAKRAADYRDKLDKKLFSNDNSTGMALTALLFISLIGMAMGGGSGGYSPGNTNWNTGPTSSGPPCRPTPYYPSNPSRSVNGNLSDPGIQWRGC